ncbi:hypothetical protein WH47_12639 [Habropoda laboriosa]|uniref:Uncharacterized protein n=1 Tax=Habropoda laboriosa TaxID=597456 RepID=A0A0L7R7K6_9HYME|nr:hypothetical protein WH47_12639 [Habropoda laboriosa]
MTFSMNEKLSSPSGHVVRTLICYEYGKATLFMMLDKMISNHYYSAQPRSRGAYVPPAIGGRASSSYDQLKARFEQIEESAKHLWHNSHELEEGIYAWMTLSGNSRYNSVARDLRIRLRGKREDAEVYTFSRKHNMCQVRQLDDRVMGEAGICCC